MTDNDNNIINTDPEQGQDPNNYSAYIEAINKLKAETVSREQYNQLQQENKTLLESIVNGQPAPTGDKEPDPLTPIADLKKGLFTPEKELTDIEYVTKALELRSRLLDEQGIDCFVGSSHQLTPTEEDYAKAEKVANVLRECLESSNGNNKLFIANLQNHINETFLPRRSR